MTDKPNLNGRVYSSEVIDDAMTSALNGDLFLYYQCSDDSFNPPAMEDAIGEIKGYTNNSGNLSVDVHMFKNRFVEFMEELIEKDLIQATLAGYGRMKGDEMIDYTISYLFLTTDVI